MKNLLVGAIFGASLTGMFMSAININLQRELDAKQVEMNRLGNQVSELKLSVYDLKLENAQLYWELEESK